MKKYIIYIAAIILGTACNQMDDVYDEIDRDPYTKDLVITLTEDDYAMISERALTYAVTSEDTAYAQSVANDNAFNDSITADEYVPYIMAQNYPALEYGSVAKVTYNTTVKSVELAQYESASSYTVSNIDYTNIGGLVGSNNSFSPAIKASSEVPSLLESTFPDALEGEAVGVTYNYSLELNDAYGYEYSFDGYADKTDVLDQDRWSQTSTQGSLTWQYREYSENGYIQFSAYDADSIEEAYLISPVINLASGSSLDFDVKFGYYNGNPLEVLISSDYAGDVTTATWTNITDVVNFPEPANGGWTNFEAVGPIDLSSYSGKIFIAFKYTGDGEGVTTTLQIDNLSITPFVARAYESVKQNDMYTFDGYEWIEADIDMLDATAYDAMGNPGKYDNFSSSDAPEDYIPTYLALGNPYAQVGDEITVAYAYYGANTSYGADVYIKEASTWNSLTEINKTPETAQFFYAANGWIFDPAVRFTMEATDYQMVVDYVESTFGEIYVDRGNSEYYYGNSAYYSNLDARISKRTEFNVPLTDAEMAEHGVETWGDNSEVSTEIIFNRVKFESIIALLEAKYPNSPVSVSGVEQTYEVTFKTYENDASSNYYTYQYKCTQAGPGAQFEFVEDITE